MSEVRQGDQGWEYGPFRASKLGLHVCGFEDLRSLPVPVDDLLRSNISVLWLEAGISAISTIHSLSQQRKLKT